jgi:acyl carrier protein
VLTNPLAGFNIFLSSELHNDGLEVIIVIFEKLRTIIAEQFSISEESVTMDTSFVDDLGADSLDAVELTMALELEFDIPEVDDEIVAGLFTVGDVFRFISQNCD